MFEGKNFDKYLTLCRAAKLTQYACDCYAYGLLAMGWADAIVEQNLGLYDVAGAVPIITGAGGVFTDWQGRPIGMDFKGEAVVASSPALAQEIRKLLV